jgi:hypothetical protein
MYEHEQITVVKPFWLQTPGSFFHHYSVGQYIVPGSVAYNWFERERTLNGTTDPPGTPFADPGTITVAHGAPGADWPP